VDLIPNGKIRSDILAQSYIPHLNPVFFRHVTATLYEWWREHGTITLFYFVFNSKTYAP